MAEGGIKRAAPGASAAEPWIAPGADGTRSTFGLLADEGTGTLWACSNDVSGWGIPGPGDTKGAWLKAFDLKSGKLKGSARLPGEDAVCNDVAVGPDGGVYVTDVAGPRILKLRPGGDGLDVWATDARLHAAPRRRRARRHRGSGATARSTSTRSARATCSGWRSRTARPGR